MPETKLIALDLDGTLLNSDKELTERTRRALEAAAEAGIEIVPAAVENAKRNAGLNGIGNAMFHAGKA